MNSIAFALAALLVSPLTLDQVSLIPTHSIHFQRFEDGQRDQQGIFYLANEQLVLARSVDSCLTIEVIAGPNQGSKLSRCFESLGKRLSMPAHSDRGSLFIAANHPGADLLEIAVAAGSIDRIFHQDYPRNVWGLDWVEADQGVLVVMPNAVSIVDRSGHEIFVGPEVSHPKGFFTHTAWATTEKGILLNVDDGLRLYSKHEETLLVHGRFDRSWDGPYFILGVADLGSSWMLLKRRDWENPPKSIVYSFVVELWDTEAMRPRASFMMPLGFYWNLHSLGDDAAVLTSHEGSRVFVITRDHRFYMMDIPIRVSRTSDRVFGRSADRFFYVSDAGYAEIRVESEHH